MKYFSILSVLLTIVLFGCCYTDDTPKTETKENSATYKVAFDANGGMGKMPEQIFVTDVSQTLNTNIFKRTGYTFAGWNTSPDGTGTDYASGNSYSLTDDITLYAQWDLISYSVTYVLNDGTNDGNNPISYNAENETITLANASRIGYTFAGWYTDEACTKQKTQIIKGSVGNIILYAKWTTDEYTITYVLNGGTNSEANPTSYSAETPTITLANASRTDYTFAGWYTDEACTKQKTQIVKGSVGDIMLYAKWISNAYTITYVLNGGTNSEANPTGYSAETPTITLANASRTGYTFAGWYTDEACTKQKTQIVKGSVGDITLYAKWMANTYTITYILNGGTNSEANPTGYSAETPTITLANASRTDYSFAGWYTDEACTKQKTQIVKGSVGNITLYAKWTANTYKITYVLNGGTNSEANPTSYNAETETIILADASRAGYTFAGWYTKKVIETEKTQITKGSVGDITLYAKWALITYKITYNLNDGTNASSNPTSYNAETETITLANPVKTGYTFAGWYTNSSFTAKKTQITKGSVGDITLYAKWTATTYKITYNLDGGTNASSNPATYNVNTSTVTLANPVKTGYTFGGWYTNSSFTAKKTQITKGSTGDITLYAKWEANTYTVTFLPGSGTLNSNSIQTVKYGEKATKPSNPTKNGHNFLGWYITTDNGTTLSNALYDFNTTITSNIKLYPVFYKPISDMVYVQGATIDGAITAEGYTSSSVFKKGQNYVIRNFYISKYEMTQGEYESNTFHSYNSPPSSTYADGSTYPVYNVSWCNVIIFCNKLSLARGLTPCYSINENTDPDYLKTKLLDDAWTVDCQNLACNFDADGYRLPTVEEWEYAARGGNGLSGYQYQYAGSDTIDDVAWYKNNSGGINHEVGRLLPNKLGLYDMNGNVFEWCWNPSNVYNLMNMEGYLMGGDWANSKAYNTVSSRTIINKWLYCESYGFRLVRTAK